MRVLLFPIIILLVAGMVTAYQPNSHEINVYNTEPYEGKAIYSLLSKLTIAGDQRFCSSTSDYTRVFLGQGGENYFTPASCNGKNALINVYRCLPGYTTISKCDNGYQYIGETETNGAPINLLYNEVYVYECYNCDVLVGTVCDLNAGDKCVTETSYTECKPNTYPFKPTYQGTYSCPVGQKCDSGECTTECNPKWNVGEWTECKDGMQSREVWDSHNCDTQDNKPAVDRTCISSEIGGFNTLKIIGTIGLFIGLIFAYIFNPIYIVLAILGAVIWLIQLI